MSFPRRGIVWAALTLALLVLPALVPLDAGAAPRWLRGAEIEVPGNPQTEECRAAVCKHNENTDLLRWQGAIYLVHRTAVSQVLGPNSSLRVYRSQDNGETFQLQGIIPARPDRDIRDPHFLIVGEKLSIVANARLPGFAVRDMGADTIGVQTSSRDGRSWSSLRTIGPGGWTFWRPVEQNGTYYSAAYEDGNRQVVLYRSADGKTWRAGPDMYTRSNESPSETELVFTPSGQQMLALMRVNGSGPEVLGNVGNLRTKLCWARRPYARFSCRAELTGVRLDGAVAFYSGARLFVIARKHLEGPEIRKRSALYEITGDLERGPLRAVELGELPSAGDTSYAGAARIGGQRFLASWYSSPPADDPSWPVGILGRTDIWKATIDLARLPAR